jgi:transcriptional regulator with XRE-family HTH domain
MTGAEIRRLRVSERLQLYVLSQRAGISRGRLSEIESGHTIATKEETARIMQALDALIEARRKVVTYAAEVGWPIATA